MSGTPIAVGSDSDKGSFDSDDDQTLVLVPGSPLKLVCSQRYRYVYTNM